MQVADAVLIKTAKGLMASRAENAEILSAELRSVLALIDGKTSMTDLVERAQTGFAPEVLAERIETLLAQGFVDNLPPPEIDVTRSQLMRTLADFDVAGPASEPGAARADAGAQRETAMPQYGRRRDDLKRELVPMANGPTLAEQFDALVSGAPGPALITRAQAHRLLKYAVERYIEAKAGQGRATNPAGGADAAAIGEMPGATERIPTLSGMPDARKMLEAVVQRERDARTCLREAQARLAEMAQSHQAAIDDETRRRESAEQRLQEAVGAASEANARAAALEATIAEHAERIGNLLATLGAREADAAESNAARFAALEQLAALRLALDERNAQLDRMTRARDEAQDAANDAERQIEGLQAERSALAQELAESRERRERAEAESASVRREADAQLAALQYANRMGVERAQDLQGRLAETRGELDAARAARDEAQARVQTLEAQGTEAASALEALRSELGPMIERARHAESALADAQAQAATQAATIECLIERIAYLESEQTRLAEAAEELARNTWDRAREELQRERAEHHAEAAKLLETVQRLDWAKGEVERERDVFEQRFADAQARLDEAERAQRSAREALGEMAGLHETLAMLEQDGRRLAKVVARVNATLERWPGRSAD